MLPHEGEGSLCCSHWERGLKGLCPHTDTHKKWRGMEWLLCKKIHERRGRDFLLCSCEEENRGMKGFVDG